MGRAGGGRSGGGSSGGGGGGRGFGGGGNRSFGGRSGGSSPGSSSGRSGGPSGGPSGGFTGPSFGGNTRGPSYGGSNYGNSYGNSPLGGGYRPPPNPMYMGRQSPPRFNSGVGGGGGSLMGCLIGPIIAIIIVVIIGVAIFSSGFSSGGGGTGEVRPSTIKREALPAGSVNETSYYTDELGWIKNPSQLTSGMKHFYDKTGVQPHLYITDNINGSTAPTEAEVEQFAAKKYDELFTDEAHILVIFFEYNESYHTWYMAGTMAQTVMDAEASDILLDYIDRYYYSDYSEDELFSKVFSESGDDIMEVAKPTWTYAIPILVVLGILAIIVIVFLWWKKSKDQKNLEAKQTKEILETPLQTYAGSEAGNLAGDYAKGDKSPAETSSTAETFAGSEAENLAKKYTDKTE